MRKKIFFAFLIFILFAEVSAGEIVLESEGNTLGRLWGLWEKDGYKTAVSISPQEGKSWLGWDIPWSVLGPLALSGVLGSPDSWDRLGCFSSLWEENYKVSLGRSADPDAKFGFAIKVPGAGIRVQTLKDKPEIAGTAGWSGGIWDGLAEVRYMHPGMCGLSLIRGSYKCWTMSMWAGISRYAENLGGVGTGRLDLRLGSFEGAVAAGIIQKDFFWAREGESGRSFWTEAGIKWKRILAGWQVVMGGQKVFLKGKGDGQFWGKGSLSLGAAPLGGDLEFYGLWSQSDQTWIQGRGELGAEVKMGTQELRLKTGIHWKKEMGFEGTAKAELGTRGAWGDGGFWALVQTLGIDEEKLSYGVDLSWLFNPWKMSAGWSRLPRTLDQSPGFSFWGKDCRLTIELRGFAEACDSK